ncbi:MAG: alkaline phosphatase family protein [Terriglobia bacterium]
MKKVLYIILDGLSDLPCGELGSKTPLEAADTPQLDGLAADGKTGLLNPVGKEVAPESDVAVICLLGYDAKKHYTGRGPLESYAAGLTVNDGDLAFRVNFATADGAEIVDRRVGRSLSSDEAHDLAKAVNDQVKLESHAATFELKATIGHRGVLVIRSDDATPLSAAVTNNDPAYGREGSFGVALTDYKNEIVECQPVSGQGSEAAKISAALTNEFVEKSRRVLEDHPVNQERVAQGNLPANVILVRDAGNRLPSLEPVGRDHGFKWGCFVEMPVEKGIALLTDMEVLELPQPTNYLSYDYSIRAKKVLEALPDFDGLYIHLKGPDEPGHDGDPVKKRDVIEAIDEYFFGALLPELRDKDVIIAVTSDHSTPCEMKSHSSDPVPLLIAGDGQVDEVTVFTEAQCAEGRIGEIPGSKLLSYLVRLSGEK